MLEIWKDIIGYEGLYQVSNLGRVKSCEKVIPHFRGGTRVLLEKLRKPSLDSDGYLVLDLYKEGKDKFFKVHRLVGFAFLELLENKNQLSFMYKIRYC